MRNTLVSLLSLFVSCFILMLGNGLINILLPVRMQLESMSTDTIGMVMSLYYVGMLPGAYISKNLIKRVGHIRLFAGSIALAAISILVCSLYTDDLLWGAMRILIGFCNACAFAAMESWLNGASTRDTRGQILAVYNAVILGAMFAGQFLINLASPSESTLFILGGIVLCMAVIPMVLGKHAGPEVVETAPMSILALAKRSPLGVVSGFTSGLIYSAAFGLLPLFASNYGISGFELSLFTGVAILGAFIFQFPVGYLSDRFDRRKVLLGVLLTSSIVGFSVEFLAETGQFFAMAAATAIAAGIIACTYPLSIAEAFDKLKQNEMVAAVGALLIIFSIGGALGPYLVSLLLKTLGNNTLFYLIGAIQLLLAGFVVIRMSIRTSLPSDQQETFVMQNAGMPSANLDPRVQYVEAALPLSSAAKTAVQIAETDPAAAVKMARAMVVAKPDQGVEIAAAVAKVEGVDPLRLYEVMLETVPFQILEVTSAIVEATPELGYELVRQLSQSHPEKVVDVAAEIGRTLPDLRLDMAKVALEAAPESAVDVAEYYSQVLAEQLESVRPADREDDHTEQEAQDLVNQIAEAAPEHSLDIAAKFVEAVPDSAASVAMDLAGNLTERSETENLDSSVTNDQPEESDSHQEAVELVSRLTEAAPGQAVDIGVAVVEVLPETAVAVASSVAERQVTHEEGDLLETEGGTEETEGGEFKQVTELVTRLSDTVPEQTADIGVAVVEVLPDSAAAIASEYAHKMSEQNEESSDISDISSQSAAEGESTPDTIEVVSKLIEAAPEQAVDISVAVIEVMPGTASDMVEIMEANEQISNEELVSTLDEKPVK